MCILYIVKFTGYFRIDFALRIRDFSEAVQTILGRQLDFSGATSTLEIKISKKKRSIIFLFSFFKFNISQKFIVGNNDILKTFQTEEQEILES